MSRVSFVIFFLGFFGSSGVFSSGHVGAGIAMTGADDAGGSMLLWPYIAGMKCVHVNCRVCLSYLIVLF